MQENFDKKKILILIIILLMIGGLVYFIMSDNKKTSTSDIAILSTKETTTTLNEFYVDIKGSVKKPGVYKFKENDRVIDAIEKAGGLKSNANTNNINLSKKLTSEMVIYVYSNKEIKNNDSLTCDNICNVEVIEVNNCIETTESSSSNNNLVNINAANEEELQTLSGIGESKAKSIIEYRNSNGSFKTIDDLKNVSGIGDALFNKIKDKITI